ncbi:MAG: LysR family transcriptional regulator [Clostridium perfringens]|nr:LysR family transcriptional regulator [Clostridium perfringens]
MELRQLEYFITVTNLKSFTKAADKLHVAQPSITIAIKKLEDNLGVTLLERKQKNINLTKEGEIFYKRANEIINSVNNVEKEMSDFKEAKKEIIKVSIPPLIGFHMLPKIFSQYYSENSSVELEIVEVGSLQTVELLEAGEIDLALIIQSHKNDCIETTSINAREILLCLPKEHPLTKENSIPFNKLKNERFLLLKEGNYIRRRILNECKEHDFEPNIIYQSTQIESICTLISSGIGVSFLLDTIAKRNTDIVCCSMERPIKVNIAIAWNKNKYITKAQKEFIEFIKHL